MNSSNLKMYKKQLQLVSGKNAIYFFVIFLIIVGFTLIAEGISAQIKIALIGECFIPLFISFVVIEALLIERYTGTREIVHSSIFSPWFFLILRLGPLLILFTVLGALFILISGLLTEGVQTLSLFWSFIFNSLSLSLLGGAVSFWGQSPGLGYLMLLGIITRSLFFDISPEWNIFPHVISLDFSSGKLIRPMQIGGSLFFFFLLKIFLVRPLK